jgi:hypothetical protein
MVTAKKCVEHGAKVVLAARREDRLKDLCESLGSDNAIFMATDVTRKEDLNNIVKYGIDTFNQIDSLVNNAGIMPLSFIEQGRTDEWDQMIDWAAKRYRDRKASGTKDTESIDLAYQYWMWLHVIGYTGVRPPFGQVKKNLLEWKSYEVLEEGTAQEMRTFKRFDEKGKKDYEAVIMPECWDVFDLMEQHRKQNDLEPTYLFQHTQNKANSWKKGDPVLNFRTSWRTMLKELGLEMPKGTPQHEKLVPYCLRGYFITMRLRDGDMRIEDLSEATGTSPEVVREIYYEFSTRKTYKKLTSGSHNARTITRQRDANGYAII